MVRPRRSIGYTRRSLPILHPGGEGWSVSGISIVPRANGRFGLTGYTGVDSQTGKERTRKWLGTYRTRREAEQARLMFMHHPLHSAGIGLYGDAHLRLETYLTQWIAARLVRGKIRPKTAEGYRALCRLHVFPRLGHVPLHRLAPPALDTLYLSLVEERGLSRATVAQIAAIMHAGLAAAVKNGLLLKNSADQTEPPQPEAYEPVILTPEQLGVYLDDVDRTCEPGLRAFYYAAIDTGCREGELLAVRETDVDLAAGVLSVRRTLRRSGREPQIGRPKSEHGIRAVKLSEAALETIRAAIVWRKTQRLRLGPRYRDAGFLFCGPMGRPFNPSNLRNRDHYPRLVRLGLLRTRIHDLRHANGTHLTAAGVDARTMSDRLGHHSPGFTLKRYTHPNTPGQLRAAEIANTLLTRRPSAVEAR